PHAAEVLAHRPHNGSQAVRMGACEQGTQRTHLHVLPGKDPVRLAPFGSDSAQNDRKRISSSDLRERAVDPRGEPAMEGSVAQAMRDPIETTAELAGLEELIPEQQSEQCQPERILREIDFA